MTRREQSDVPPLYAPEHTERLKCDPSHLRSDVRTGRIGAPVSARVAPSHERERQGLRVS